MEKTVFSLNKQKDYYLDAMTDEHKNNEVSHENGIIAEILPNWIRHLGNPSQIELDLNSISGENLRKIDKFWTAVIQKYEEVKSDGNLNILTCLNSNKKQDK